jgi:hypothetical protein
MTLNSWIHFPTDREQLATAHGVLPNQIEFVEFSNNNWTSSGDPPAESEDSQAGSLRSGMVTPRSCTTSLG